MLYRFMGLFQGENGSQGVAMKSAVVTRAAKNNSAILTLGSRD